MENFQIDFYKFFRKSILCNDFQLNKTSKLKPNFFSRVFLSEPKHFPVLSAYAKFVRKNFRNFF